MGLSSACRVLSSASSISRGLVATWSSMPTRVAVADVADQVNRIVRAVAVSDTRVVKGQDVEAQVYQGGDLPIPGASTFGRAAVHQAQAAVTGARHHCGQSGTVRDADIDHLGVPAVGQATCGSSRRGCRRRWPVGRSRPRCLLLRSYQVASLVSR